MTNTKASIGPGTRMTIRVYTVDSEGHVKRDTGTREYVGTEATSDIGRNPISLPACTCAWCRARGAKQ